MAADRVFQLLEDACIMGDVDRLMQARIFEGHVHKSDPLLATLARALRLG